MLPDFFRGDYAGATLLSEPPKFMEWLHAKATTEVVMPDVLRVESYLKESGVKAATLVGFCWGAKVN